MLSRSKIEVNVIRNGAANLVVAEELTYLYTLVQEFHLYSLV